MNGKIYIPIIHELLCGFLDVSGATNQKAGIPSFTTGDVWIFPQALYKDGAAKIMKDLRLHGLLPESLEFLSPSQAGGFSGHQGAVRSVANQMKEKNGVLPTLAAAASELGRRGNQQGALDAIVATGIAPAHLHSVESAHTTATSTTLLRQELLPSPRMPLHFVESAHTKAKRRRPMRPLRHQMWRRRRGRRRFSLSGKNSLRLECNT
jgi:hypothetical protein